MADDRYSWLDKNAAERLLRGEPADAAVGADDAYVRAQAERLSEALADAAVVALAGSGPEAGLPEGELPGEAAAAAAFRKAVEARADSSRAISTRGERSADVVPPTVRISRTLWPSRIGRPLRAGLAVALAGCALGGVAVAAGTGVLPTPFGGESGEPVPGQSVSAAATPGEDFPAPSVTEGTELPSLTPDPNGTAGEGEGGATGGERSPGGRHDSAGSGSTTDDEATGPGGYGDRNKLRLAITLCRKHESGDLDENTERRLERSAGGAKALDRYCDKLLSGENRGSGGSDAQDDGKGDSNGDGGGNGGQGQDDGSGEGDDEGGDGADGERSGSNGDVKQPSAYTPLSSEQLEPTVSRAAYASESAG
ncbi:hypothetical protein ABZW18_09255 [Streptomyces sp. NPDC004647]|uniref:hypothetical protein n=1 Tax=Streptomyces sp. NPDC004647 TaxID=3154671 RepID=UPI00339FD6EA